jgi:hypothetical protein
MPTGRGPAPAPHQTSRGKLERQAYNDAMVTKNSQVCTLKVL